MQVLLGRVKCLHALGEWEKLSRVVEETWPKAPMSIRPRLAPMAAESAWNLSSWDKMQIYVNELDNSVDGGFFKAIISIRSNRFDDAQQSIDMARRLIDTRLTALVAESYNRAFKVIIK